MRKGDRLASSAIPGVAQAVADDDATAFNVVARALQDKYNSNTETIMCVINKGLKIWHIKQEIQY